MYNKNNKLDYCLHYDYIQKYCLESIYSIPKVENLTVTLYQKPLKSQKQATNSLDPLTDTNQQIKSALLYYLLINKIPKIKAISDSKFKKQLEPTIKYIQQISVKNSNDIYNLLNIFFLGQNIEDFLSNTSFTNNISVGKTTIVIKYPLVLLNEAQEFDQLYNISIKEYFFSISIVVNKIITKNQILELFYFG